MLHGNFRVTHLFPGISFFRNPEFSDAAKEHVDDRRFAGMIENEVDCLLLCSERKCACSTCCETSKKYLQNKENNIKKTYRNILFDAKIVQNI